ncbi:MAG: glycine cleavage system aminomethyltransferase GcvT [Candidatus Thermoplasmatota archaeon]|nr:glycine cleavage system aminomethyltransferase GcvT [Candidatus Thermoplasmatota archaeon]
MSYSELLDKELEEIDADTKAIIDFEEERQTNKIILIASESICPKAVKQALGSAFTSLYAEGYPPKRLAQQSIERIRDYKTELSYQRRYGDRRYYKGCEYVNFIESLAQRRCAELFSTPEIPAEKIFVNVQPLSGAAANNAVYEAFLNPGDTVMGLALDSGGHLTHGSPANRSGKLYKVVSYEVDKNTGKLNYESIKKLALEHKPKMIIAGYSAYPWSVDWGKFSEIAKGCNAILLADIAHPAGLVVAGKFPNPIGYADVITFTTHKTICGPRGAVIITVDEEKARKIDAAVFPEEQGGPHICNIAAKAVAFELAKTRAFRELQERTVENAQNLAKEFEKRGLKLAYGGTDTHMVLLDLKPLKLSGEIASRILDICGIVCNKNAIMGDVNPAHPSGLRFGTTWISQLGFGKAEIEKLAELIWKVLVNIKPFHYIGITGELGRGKIELEIIAETSFEISKLCERARYKPRFTGKCYPHYYVSDREVESHKMPEYYESIEKELEAAKNGVAIFDLRDYGLLEITGDRERAEAFIQEVSTNNTLNLEVGYAQYSILLDRASNVLDVVIVARLQNDALGRAHFLVITNPENTEKIKLWLRALSDGYVIFDEDIYRKIEGPVIVEDLKEISESILVAGIQGPKTQQLLQRLLPNLENMKVGIIRTGKKPFEILFYTSLSSAEKLLSVILKKGSELGARQIGKVAGAKLIAEKLPNSDLFNFAKPYFIGCTNLAKGEKLARKSELRYVPKVKVRKSYLYDEHLKLTNHFTNFANWEMPLVYTNVNEEHRAVRERAGLFDVSHMGIIEVKGEYSTRFLDLVTTNYVPLLKVGESQYSYILDPEGQVMDDVFIYRLANDRYIIVTNAANADKIKEWLVSVNSKNICIDNDRPCIEVEGEVTISDLKLSEAGEEQKIDIALQGPNSLKIIQELADSATKKIIAELRKNELAEVELAGIKLIISRTGYTGENIGYELFLHPKQAPKLWNLILEKGKEFGAKPCGLACRDSTRIEAGLPLYGHELAGEHKITPSGAGFGAFVKLHKPYFIGRSKFIEFEKLRKQEIVRFKLDRKGARALRPGDSVLNQKGESIGVVTSAALVDYIQVGLAYVNKDCAREGTKIAISQLRAGKILGPESATVMTRFPLRKELLPGERYQFGFA